MISCRSSALSTLDYDYDSRGERLITFPTLRVSASPRLFNPLSHRGSQSIRQPHGRPCSPVDLLFSTFDYDYDDQGNRTTDGTTENYREEAETNLRKSTYTVNSLNQYTSRTIPAFVDVAGAYSGNVTMKGNTVSHNVDTQGDYFYSLLDDAGTDGYDNSTTDLSIDVEISAGGELNEGDVYIAEDAETFTYDDDGNMESGVLWDYVWDAENRLETMTMKSSLPTGMTRKRLEFTYDYLGRRVEKKVIDDYGGAGETTESHLKYVYDGWNMIAELDGESSNAVLRTYVWGLDLSGTTQGAGGVGGLLMVKNGTNQYVTAYDGNGNVSALLNATNGTLEAKYEYGAFGETLRIGGTGGTGIEYLNPFRFSTKYTDDTTDLIYYGHRYYSPRLGRFLNRDPIAEGGGLNLYGFVNNSPVNGWDYLGLTIDDGGGDFDWDLLCSIYPDSCVGPISSGGLDADVVDDALFPMEGPSYEGEVPPSDEELLASLYFENGVRFLDYLGEFMRLPHQILTDNDIFEIVRPKELLRTVRRSKVGFRFSAAGASLGDEFELSDWDKTRLENYVSISDIAIVVDEAVAFSSVLELIIGGGGKNVDRSRRYIYLEGPGWVDLQHVVSSGTVLGAHIGVGFDGGLVVEAAQLITHPNSAFQDEDLRSNFIGSLAAYYAYINEVSLGEAVEYILQNIPSVDRERAKELIIKGVSNEP